MISRNQQPPAVPMTAQAGGTFSTGQDNKVREATLKQFRFQQIPTTFRIVVSLACLVIAALLFTGCVSPSPNNKKTIIATETPISTAAITPHLTKTVSMADQALPLSIGSTSNVVGTISITVSNGVTNVFVWNNPKYTGVIDTHYVLTNSILNGIDETYQTHWFNVHISPQAIPNLWPNGNWYNVKLLRTTNMVDWPVIDGGWCKISNSGLWLHDTNPPAWQAHYKTAIDL